MSGWELSLVFVVGIALGGLAVVLPLWIAYRIGLFDDNTPFIDERQDRGDMDIDDDGRVRKWRGPQ